MRQNRKLQVTILIVLICLVASLSIAYATLSVTLNIIGTAQLADASWNVHFANVNIAANSVPISPKIVDNTKISFSASLENPGDFYKFTVDIVNSGTIDAVIDTITVSPELTTTQKKYLKYEIKYTDGQVISTKQLLKAQETKTISILFSFRNDIPVSDLPTESSSFNHEISLVYYQDDDTGHANYSSVIAKVVNGNINIPGSEVCIGTECFYIVSNDGEKVKMLTKYNLHVGNICYPSNGCTPIINPTGIQDETARGWFNGWYNSNQMVGITPFSDSAYWASTTSTYPAYVYNASSKIYNYIENYKTYLTTLGATIISARPPSYDEFFEMGCTKENGRDTCKTAPPWVYQTSYWGGNALDENTALNLDQDGNLNYLTYAHIDYGVRPIIEIPISNF